MAKLPNKTRETKTETVRERAEKASNQPAKTRRLRSTAGAASKPVKLAGRGIKKAVSPLAFLLKPFQSAPMRKLGRILGAILLLNYFRSSWQELRQVEWPNRKDTAKLTFAVFIFAIVFSLIIAATDYGLDKVFRKVLIK